jgi:hypothetical protein
MAALDWFESILAEGERIKKIKQNLAILDSRIAPHGQGFEPMGHGGGSSDAMLGMAMVSAKLAELRRLLPELERKHEAKLRQATEVLYGRSGRGGLARATCTDDADMLCFHYLQGESWASIGRRYNPDASNLTVWCKRRAAWACRKIDEIGMEVLAES